MMVIVIIDDDDDDDNNGDDDDAYVDFIKYQTLNIEFLVIWLVLYSQYKNYIL